MRKEREQQKKGSRKEEVHGGVNDGISFSFSVISNGKMKKIYRELNMGIW